MGNSSSRTHTYQQYYQALEHGVPVDLDPYEVLGVAKQHTWDELKSAYRRTAALVHPDKGGSPEVFHYVTECFKKLAYELKAREADRPHFELKQQSHAFMAQQPTARAPETATEGGEDFLDRFNRMFEDNRLEDEEHGFGYGHMMEKSSAKRDDIQVKNYIKGSFTNEKFNQVFDKKVPVSKDVVVYKEPEPMSLAKRLACTEIGADRPDDYSSSVEKGSRQNLAYTDYMKAHTTTRLVDPRLGARKEYRNVKEYERARAGAVASGPTEEERAWMEEKQRQEEEAEAKRLQRVQERDRLVGSHYDRVNQLMLAGRK